MATSRPSLLFRPVRASDLDVCTQIETASYPADEAASPQALQYRQAHAGAYFHCACLADSDNKTVIGFVCATRCTSFTHESMATHNPQGPLLAIHSVVVHKDYRRQGIATQMLRHYVQQIEQDEAQNKNNKSSTSPPLTKMVLLAKAHLLAFYVNCGFTVTRPSPIVHGQELWYELERPLTTTSNPRQAPCFVVDAFGKPGQRGTGNPAAVVLLEHDPTLDKDNTDGQAWMQSVAAEFNLSETAFVWPLEKDTTQQFLFAIRYFTPTTEVPLCGHATLASASVLYQTGRVPLDQPVALQALQDLLHACTVDNKDATYISMTFPAKPAVELQSPAERDAALDMVQQAFPGLPLSQIAWLGISPGVGDLLIQVHSPDLLRSLSMNFEAMKADNIYSRGIIVTAAAAADHATDDDPVDFVSRFFAPKAGINEDPVTGSAHTVLAPHYYYNTVRKNESNQKDNGSKTTFKAQQWSPRGGWLTCTLVSSADEKTKDKDHDLVEIAGRAVTTLQGRLQ